MAITPAKTFRKRTEETTEQRAKQTPGQVYGQGDASKRLGREARTGIETDIAARTADLKFDVSGEKAVREQEIDRKAKEGRERLARTFGLTSSGIQQGRAIRAFSGLEGETLKQHADLASEMSQRRGQEQRANVQSLLQAQESREAADLRAREATGQDVDRQQRALDTGEQLEFQRGVATGEIGGEATLGAKQQAEIERAAKVREEQLGRQLTEAERAALVGEEQQDIAQTEVERATKVREQQLGRQLTEAERAALASEMQQATAQTEIERATRVREEQLGRQLTEAERSALVRETQQAAVQAEVERASLVREEQLGRQMTEAERTALVSEKQQEAVLTETNRAAEEQEKLLGRRLTEEERSALIRETLQTTAQTEVKRSAEEQEKLLGRRLTEEERSGIERDALAKAAQDETKIARIAQQQMQLRAQLDTEVNNALQRAVTQGQATGEFVDPETGVSQVTLEAEMQRRQQAGAERQMSETERAALVAEEDRRATLTGVVPGDQSINPEAIRNMFGLDPTMSQEDVAAEVSQYGFVRDPQTGLYTAPAAVTVEARMQAAQSYAVRRGVDIQADAQTAEAAAMKSKSAIDQAAISGKITLFDENGEPVRDRYGEPITLNTIAAEELLLREQEATGVIDGADTMENKKFQLQAEIERGQAFLREELQTANIAFRESDITGTYSKMGASEAGQFYRAFAASKEGNEFNPRYDLNGDGEVNFGDFTEFSKISNGEPVTTLKGKMLENDNAARLFGEKIEEARVTGLIDGEFTVQDLSRQFEEERVITDMYGGKPPTTFTERDLTVAFPYGKERTDPDFRADLDFNSDGINDFADFVIGSQQVNASKMAAADTERLGELEAKTRLTPDETAELSDINKRMSGNRTKLVDGTTGMFMYQPPGPQTLKAQQLGISEKQFVEGSRRWHAEFGQQIADYKSRFSGYMVDEDGHPEWIQKYNEETGQSEWLQPTRSEREIFDKQMDQLDTVMQKGGMKKFAENMGLQWDPTNKLNRQEQLALVQAVMSSMFNPVSPTAMPSKGKWWEQGLSSITQIGSAFASSSDRNIKHDVQDISAKDVLDMAKSVPVSLWRYDEDPSTQHIGPMAQDFKNAFGVGSSDKTIHVVDMFGVALASIQALSKEVESLKSEVKRLSN